MQRRGLEILEMAAAAAQGMAVRAGLRARRRQRRVSHGLGTERVRVGWGGGDAGQGRVHVAAFHVQHAMPCRPGHDSPPLPVPTTMRPM